MKQPAISYPDLNFSVFSQKGANEDDRSKAKPVSGRMCSMTQMRFFRTRYKHIFVEFVRQRGSGPAHRGFVVGFKGYFFEKGKYQSLTHR